MSIPLLGLFVFHSGYDPGAHWQCSWCDTTAKWSLVIIIFNQQISSQLGPCVLTLIDKTHKRRGTLYCLTRWVVEWVRRGIREWVKRGSSAGTACNRAFAYRGLQTHTQALILPSAAGLVFMGSKSPSNHNTPQVCVTGAGSAGTVLFLFEVLLRIAVAIIK